MKKEIEQMDSVDMELQKLKEENENLRNEVATYKTLYEYSTRENQELKTKTEAIKLLLR
jgi:FtsZ-binding cell division protein ZapB